MYIRLATLKTSIAKQIANYIKHKTCRNKNPTARKGEQNIKRSYPSMNALHCLKYLYALIVPSASQINTWRKFSAILVGIKHEITRSRVNQSDQ